MRDPTLIEEGFLAKVPVPQQDRNEEHYTVIPSRPLRQFYFNMEDRFDHFDIVLGDWGVSSWADNHLTELIQPVALRAPEVLIGAPWDKTVDLWNLGALVPELFRAIRVFSGDNAQGQYELKEHLAEIVHLCGPFPKTLLDKSGTDIQEMFDDHGRVKDLQMPSDRPTLTSEVFAPDMDQYDRDEFVAFMQSLMKIDPADRPTPEDLLRGPWLRAIA